MGTRLMEASNAVWVGKNRDSWPVSDFIACCQWCNHQVLSTRYDRPDRGKFVTRGAVCWLRETTTKCLSQKASMLHWRQQHLILHSGKFKAKVTNNRRVFIIVKLTTDIHKQDAYKFGKIKFPEFSRFSRPSKQSFTDNYKVKTRCNKSP